MSNTSSRTKHHHQLCGLQSSHAYPVLHHLMCDLENTGTFGDTALKTFQPNSGTNRHIAVVAHACMAPQSAGLCSSTSASIKALAAPRGPSEHSVPTNVEAMPHCYTPLPQPDLDIRLQQLQAGLFDDPVEIKPHARLWRPRLHKLHKDSHQRTARTLPRD